MWTVDHDGLPDVDLQDPTLRLTSSQQAACALDREIMVQAGAGSGKTHTLSVRHLRLMVRLAAESAWSGSDQAPDLDRVLVLTFTEKAAQEMAERCHGRLLRLVRTLNLAPPAHLTSLGSRGPAFRHALTRLLDGFEGARISTFHSFCGRVLREFPAETATDPEYSVLDEEEADLLRRGAISTLLRDALASGEADLGLAMDSLGSRGATEQALQRLVASRHHLREVLSEHAAGNLPLAGWLSRAALPPAALEIRIQQHLSPLLSALAAILSTGPASQRQQNALALDQACRTPPDDLLARYSLYRLILSELLTAGGPRKLTHHSFMGSRAAWDAAGGDYRSAKASLDQLQAALDGLGAWGTDLSCLPSELDRTLWPVLQALSRLASQAAGHYEEALRSRRALDFSALQDRVHLALGHQEFRQALCQRHRYLMVDEFQDTDAVQWNIVSAIGRPAGQPADRIFLVGDPQQAIYGFRGGDVTVFTGVAREFCAAGNPPVVLEHNFRSRPALVHWFNQALGPVLGPPDPARPPWEAAYQPIVPGREATGGTITLVSHDSRGAKGALVEADALARLLRDLILAEKPPFDGLNLHDRGAHPAPPVGVLIRRRTHLATLEHVLRQAQVQYLVVGGVGFWQRPEVLDVANALHALAHQDPLSLLGVLRSPLLGLDDAEIAALHKLGLLHDFGPVRLPDHFSARAHAARDRWLALRRLRHRLPPSVLVETLLQRCQAYHAAWCQSPDGRAAANLDRLLALARRFDTRERHGLGDLARSLRQHIDEESREQEAALAPDEARVVVMTVHAAKGLEFPVVVVPDLSAAERGETDGLTIARLDETWTFACMVADRSQGRLDRGSPGLRETLRQQLVAERRAESRRLLYVACTRAQDHLVLLGNTDGEVRAPPRHWMDMLLDGGGFPAPTPPAEDNTALPAATWPATTATVQHLSVEALVALPAAPAPPTPPVPSPSQDSARRTRAISHRAMVEVSPSGLDLFAACPARWMRRHMLGIPERIPTAGERHRLLAQARGEVIHSLLEDGLLEDCLLETGAIRAESLAAGGVVAARWHARAHTDGATPAELEAGLAAIADQLTQAAANPRLCRLLAAPGDNELAFRVEWEGVVLKGVIDRLCQDPTGGQQVMDYKTGGVRGALAAEAAKHRQQLLVYTLAAREILTRQAGGDAVPPVHATVFFTDVGEFFDYPAPSPDEEASLRLRLQQLAHLAASQQSWAQVEAAAVEGTQTRPCGQCGYRRRGCRGREA